MRAKNLFDFERKASTVIFLSAILVVTGIFVWWLNIPFIEDIFTFGTVMLIMVLGFQLYMGNSGILNWSYVGYVGIGAFASAILSMTPALKAMQIPIMYPFLIKLHLPFPLALLAGALIAMIVAAIVAWPLMRLSDSVGAITLFALLIVINVLLAQWAQVTNGPRTFTLGGTRFTTLWVALGVAVLVIIAVFYFKESSLGLKLRASRDDRHAARSSGINFIAVRYYGYVASAFVGGLAGGLYSHYILSITASSFYMNELFLLLSMLVIGGSMSVSGAFFGTFLVTLIRQILRQIEQLLTRGGIEASGSTEIVVALMMIAFLIWRADGLTGGGELSWQTIKRKLRLKPKKENS
jgi:branched-chain amino acid transport system permease protein